MGDRAGRRLLRAALPIAILCVCAPNAAAQTTTAGARVRYARLPLAFEANRGQTDRRVDFLARGSGYTLFLSHGRAVLALRAGRRRERVVAMRLAGAAERPRAMASGELPGTTNYLLGSDRRAWRTGVRSYARVAYRGVYPGIDLVYHGNQSRLEYDFVVAPGADPQRISLAFRGANRLRLDGRGDLLLGSLRLLKPHLYQLIAGARRAVPGGFVLRGGQAGFRVGRYDRRRPLVIDPQLVYSTYLGGSGVDYALGLAVDAAGETYLTGMTQSANFPITTGAFQTSLTGSTLPQGVFVAKLNATGTALVYSTYLGASPFGGMRGDAIAVDASGDAYVAGVTDSPDFPTTPGAFQTTYGGGGDAFVTELNPSGSGLVYSTYLGGADADEAYGIAVDGYRHAFVAGATASPDFPTTIGAFQTTYGGGGNDAFVTELNSAGSAPIYSTFIGGTGNDAARGGIALDTAGNAYVTGHAGPGFPTTAGAAQTAFGGGDDAFVAKVAAGGGSLAYSTYIGGSGGDVGWGIAVDRLGSAYVNGETDSTDLPVTSGAFQTTYGGGLQDVFAAKLNPAGSAFAYLTYLGGGGDDIGQGIAVDGVGDAWLTGESIGGAFPTTAGAYQTAYGGGASDAFVTELDPTGSGLVYSTYLGGGDDDVGTRVAVGGCDNVYVAGGTRSTDFPTTTGAYQTTSGGSSDSFLAELQIYTPVLSVPAAGAATWTPYGWGADWGGELGLGVSGNSYDTAQLLSAFGGPVHVAAGRGTTFAIQPDGTVQGSGNNSYGQLGTGTSVGTVTTTPTTLANLSDVRAVSGGFQFGVALEGDGSVWSWGDDSSGQLGTGAPPGSNCTSATYSSGCAVPERVSGLAPTCPDEQAVAVAAGDYFALALISDGTVRAWGDDGSGQLGDGGASGGSSGYSSTPVAAIGLRGVKAIAAPKDANGAGSTALALKTDGTVWGWGSSWFGLLGAGCQPPGCQSDVPPMQVQGLQNVTQVALSYNHALALESDGTVWAWGSDAEGSLGDGEATTGSCPSGATQCTATPIQVQGLPTIVGVAADGYVSLAVGADGSVWSWGATDCCNNPGEDGQDNQGSWSATPQRVIGLSGVTEVSANGGHAVALGTENTPAGSNVTVQPVVPETGTSPVTLTFSSVTAAGETTVTTSSLYATPPPNVQLGNPPVYYDITTTATYSGPIEICIDTTSSPPPDILHYDSTLNKWVDVTTSINGSVVCGTVNSLSPFVLATSLYDVKTLYDTTRPAKQGSVVPVKLEVLEAGANVSSATLPVTAVSLDAGTLAAAGNANPGGAFRFDPTLGDSGGYVYDLDTKGVPAGTRTLVLRIGDDPIPQRVRFTVRS